ncbi:DUF3098 domain-containing protein [Pinibacter soli]|uniref:DUF3098 domain-containing protein n=1 Tax=Pinibacter soli TaxID=3044211 RepID=A0ABT6RIR5_9BACT|nr:DUF3098 domain-containing protein [Pinibacter soli]MDI3322467.1 DUF3098 domain-containing protein [Pinibacter soli]
MSEKKVITAKKSSSSNLVLGKENFMWMLVGVAIIALGMLLMAGGKSSNPAEFNQNEVYSTRRITIAPLLIIIGLGVEVFAIFKKPKA